MAPAHSARSRRSDPGTKTRRRTNWQRTRVATTLRAPPAAGTVSRTRNSARIPEHGNDRVRLTEDSQAYGPPGTPVRVKGAASHHAPDDNEIASGRGLASECRVQRTALTSKPAARSNFVVIG